MTNGFTQNRERQTADINDAKNPTRRFLSLLDPRTSIGLDGIPPESIREWNWQEIVDVSDRHRLSAVLYRQLKSCPFKEMVPEQILEQLKMRYLYAAVHNTRFYHHLRSILEALNREKIPVILLKGAHLAKFVYNRIGLRTMNDLDILVRKKDLPGAVEVLEELDYKTFRPFGFDLETSSCQHLPTFGKKGAFPVEIHANIESPTTGFRIDPEGLWERAVAKKLDGNDALVLAPEDLILSLSTHLAHHHMFDMGFVSLWDLGQCLEHFDDKINWEIVVRRAREWKASPCLYLTLYLLEKWLKAPVPESVLGEIQPERIDPRFISWAEETLFWDGKGSSPTLIQDQNKIIYNLGQTLPEKIRMVIKIFFPPLSDLAQIYGVPSKKPGIYCYYPIRVWDQAVNQKNKYLQRRENKRQNRINNTSENNRPTAENRAEILRKWMTSQ